MISTLRGRLTHKDTQHIVLECHGVGYGVHMSLGCLANAPDVGAELFVWIHTYVTEDALRLYGFLQHEQRNMFELFLGINGVGPRLALAIIGTMPIEELRTAVAQNDKSRLIRIPGVGAKKAERLLLELKDKLTNVQTQTLLGHSDNRLHDLQSALLNLGFAPNVAEQSARHALKLLQDEQDLPTLVREALRSTKTRTDSKTRQDH